MIFSPSTGIISVNKAFVRSGVRRRRWLLPPLVRTRTPVPVRRNRLEVALWVFNLIFPAFTFLGTAKLLFLKNLRLSLAAAGVENSGRLLKLYSDIPAASSLTAAFSSVSAFFFVNFSGASSMVITRPSMLGICSTEPISESSSATSLRSSSASSG